MKGLLILFTTTALWGQPAFLDLAPNGDGSVVYFSSQLRMRGTDQYPQQYKIFVWDQKSGVRLYDQRPPTVRGPTSDTAYNLLRPSISSDGRTVAVTGLSDCSYGSGCATHIERYEAAIRVGGGEPLVVKGLPSVSSNGRFVALGSSVPSPFETPVLTILNLATGAQQHPVLRIDIPRRHGVTNDGSIVIRDSVPTETVRLRPWSGPARPLNVPPYASFRIDASGTRVFYEDYDAPTNRIRLMVLDLETGTASQITAFDPTLSDPPFDISDDGSLAAFVWSGHAWIVKVDGTGTRPVTDGPDTVAEIALSGSGSHLFAITDRSRMLRIDLKTLQAEEIISATVIARGGHLTASPVSPGETAVVKSNVAPLPAIQSISLFDLALTILNPSPGEMTVQLPYEIREGWGWPVAVLKQQSNGPFEGALLWSFPIEVSNYSPRWHFDTGQVAALHQDFSGSVTFARPARPGEVVHVYGAGFGPVAPPPPPAQPASANPLSRVTAPFSCSLGRVPVEVLFAGLAPGWIGLYQVDIRLPTNAEPSARELICGQSNLPFRYASGLLPVSTVALTSPDRSQAVGP